MRDVADSRFCVVTYNYSHRHHGPSRQLLGWRHSELRPHGGGCLALRMSREYWLATGFGRATLLFLGCTCRHPYSIPFTPLPYLLPDSEQFTPKPKYWHICESNAPQNGPFSWTRSPLSRQLQYKSTSKTPLQISHLRKNRSHPPAQRILQSLLCSWAVGADRGFFSEPASLPPA